MSQFSNYLRDTAAEMKHVRWPSRKQAIIYTIIVILISAAVAAFTAGFDYIFTSLLNLVV